MIGAGNEPTLGPMRRSTLGSCCGVACRSPVMAPCLRQYVILLTKAFDILLKIRVHHIAWDERPARSIVLRCPGIRGNSPLVPENRLRERMKFHAGEMRILPIR